MEGDVAEWRTRFTSLTPSEDQRSTFRTNMPWSISLTEIRRELRGVEENSLAIAFLAGIYIRDDKSNTRRRCNGTSIL